MKNCCLCSNPSHTNYKNLPLCHKCFNMVVNKFDFWEVLLDKIEAHFESLEPCKVISLEDYKQRKKRG